MKVFSLLSIFSVLGPLIFGLGFCGEASAQSAYGAYGFYPQGSARVIAMAGAFTALSDDASASIFNPAGLAVARWTFDVAGDNNKIVNKEADVTGDGRQDGLPFETANLSVAARWGDFGFAVGQTDQYNLDFGKSSDFSTRIGLLVQSQDVGLAWSPGKTWSVGVTAHSEKTNLQYEDKIAVTTYEDEATGFFYTLGFIYQPNNRFRIGLMYRPERLYDIDETLNTTSSTDVFHDVFIPSQTNLGFLLRTSNKLKWTFDVSRYSANGTLRYVGSAGTTFISQPTTILRTGFEYAVITDKKIDFIWRGGGYKEESRLLGVPSKLHFTMGVSMRWGFLTFGAAYDQAADFSATAQSVGVSISAITKEL